MRGVDKEEIAEISGIFAGDGTIYKTNRSVVLEVRGSSKEGEYYRKTVAPLFGKLFREKLKILKRKYNDGFCFGVRVCGRKVYEFSHRYGFPIGKKSRTVDVPTFIILSKSPRIWAAYLRGLFDTDGSIYLRRQKKTIRQPIVEFRSVSKRHLARISLLLKRLGFNCWIEKGDKVRFGGWKPTLKFFILIRPNNNKHIRRFYEIYAEKAGVA